MVRINFWERTSINVVANVLRTLVMTLVGLFLTPYYLLQLGPSVYAIIPLATTISSYVLIVSDALVDSCGRYVSLTLRKNNATESVTTYSTAVCGVMRMCLIVLPVCFAVSYLAPTIFNIPDGSEVDVQVMFALVLTSSIIVSMSSMLSSLFLAHNEMYLVHIARLTYTVVQVAIIVLLFSVGVPSLTNIGVAYLWSSVILVATLALFMRLLSSRPRFDWRSYDRSLFKKMSALSTWSIITKLGSLLFGLSLILVNIYLGEKKEAGFAILATMLSMIGTTVISVSSSIEPLLYRLYAENRKKDMIETVRVGEKVLGFTMAMPVAFLMAFIPNVLAAWVGSEYTYLSGLFILAVTGYMIHCCEKSTTVLPMLYLKNQYSAAATIAFGIVNCIAACLVMSFTDWDLLGVTGVWTVCFFVEELSCILICMHISHAKKADYLIPVAETYAICGVLHLLFWTISKNIDIGDTWLTIIPIFIAMFLVYLMVMFRFMLSKRDLVLICGVLPGILKRFAIRFGKH